MNKVFVTYGDSGYEKAKIKIINEAKSSGQFDLIRAYGRENLSVELLESDIIKVKRGGGLWSWKPDIILTTMNNCQDGDIIVYCDAGCSVYRSREWIKIWKLLSNYDIISQRIYQQTSHWTRREIVDYFSENGFAWLRQDQYLATSVLLKVSDFTRSFVSEWRQLMIEHPEFVMDVPIEKLPLQLPGFIENRHDQSVYSALIYKCLNNPETRGHVYTQWEHIEDYDPIFKQAIRSTRLRNGEDESFNSKLIGCVKRLIKDYCLKPFYYQPRNWWVENQINKK